MLISAVALLLTLFKQLRQTLHYLRVFVPQVIAFIRVLLKVIKLPRSSGYRLFTAGTDPPAGRLRLKYQLPIALPYREHPENRMMNDSRPNRFVKLSTQKSRKNIKAIRPGVIR